MSSPSDSNDVPRIYAVRFSQWARRDLLNEFTRLAEVQGEMLAKQWYDGIREAVGALATMPHRYALLEEESQWVERDVRRLQYKRTPGSAMYYALYTLENGEDGPQVLIHHVRHSAMKPLTEEEVRAWRTVG